MQPQEGSRLAPATGADGKPVALALVRSMIAAANAESPSIRPDEKAFLQNLSQSLKLPGGLVGAGIGSDRRET